MKLPLVVSSLDEIDDQYRGLYQEQSDGKFHLNLMEPVVPKGKLDEFRNNNIAYKKQLEQLQAQVDKYKDLDPEKARQALQKMQELEDKKMIDAGKLEELLEQRTERMRADFEAQQKALAKANDEMAAKLSSAETKLKDLILDRGIQSVVSQVAPLKRGALMDAITRGRMVFSLDENHEPVALDEKGTIRYGKDGKSPLTLEEWASGLLEEAPHLFEDSQGGGARGGARGGAGNVITISELRERGASGGGDADLIDGLASGEIQVTEG